MHRKRAARVLIADDHRLVAETCKSVLEPEFEILGVHTDGRSLVQAALSLRPDLVLLDIGMPQLNGLDAGEQIKAKLTRVKLVFLTVNVAPDVVAEAFGRGASAYVLKQSAAEELLTALRKVLRTKAFFDKHEPIFRRITAEWARENPEYDMWGVIDPEPSN